MVPRDNVGWLWSDAHLLDVCVCDLFFLSFWPRTTEDVDVSTQAQKTQSSEEQSRWQESRKSKEANIQTRLSRHIQHKLSAATPETMTLLFCISTCLWYAVPSFSPSSEVKAYFFKKHFWRDAPRWASELLTHFETISVTLTYIVPRLKAQTLGSFSPTISWAFPQTHASSTEAL